MFLIATTDARLSQSINQVYFSHFVWFLLHFLDCKNKLREYWLARITDKLMMIGSQFMLTTLADRQQSVLINGELSEPHSIRLGVPQGSILGPLLFNVYINSLPNAVKKTRMILYADDAVLFYDASTTHELRTSNYSGT